MADSAPVVMHWFRRDLRLEDNTALFHALKSGFKVVPVFIFDRNILDKLEDKQDARVQFIHRELNAIGELLRSFGSYVDVRYGFPDKVWPELLNEYNVKAVYTNRDYEPYAVSRDKNVASMLASRGIDFLTFKDHVIFEPQEVLKDDGTPYVVYTPYSKKWLSLLEEDHLLAKDSSLYYDHFRKAGFRGIPSLEDMGFRTFSFEYPQRTVSSELLRAYAKSRDIPSIRGTSRLSVHLRFGTVSIRQLTRVAKQNSESWLNELIWRNFYQAIIWHFPDRIQNAFKPDYDRIVWRNNPDEFKSWCEGKTGYPIVDAGMRELNATGFMHNRVRMITASFLTKHLLIDWRWGEAYFAARLLDFELGSNNGGWQWASGSGCDAAPYFRVFNPLLQTEKFDPQYRYIRKWVPEFGTSAYQRPIVDHKMARERAIATFKEALS